MKTTQVLKAPEKAKAKIWEIAEKNDLADIVIGWGVDWIYHLILKEVEEDIFTPMDDICLDVLNRLNEI